MVSLFADHWTCVEGSAGVCRALNPYVFMTSSVISLTHFLCERSDGFFAAGAFKKKRSRIVLRHASACFDIEREKPA
jgi:hypothetical protein